MNNTNINTNNIIAGRVAMVYKGEWNTNTNYSILDVVTYYGCSYCLYKQCPISTLPGNTNYWFKVAQNGTNLKIDNVVDNVSDLPTPEEEGLIYFVKQGSNQETNVLYFSQNNGSSYIWVKMCQINQQGNNIKTGNGAPSASVSGHIGDLYLDYSESKIYEYIAVQSGNNPWLLKGSLGGISTNLSGTITLYAQQSPNYWHTETETIDEQQITSYVYITSAINGLDINDSPIIGLDSVSDTNFSNWNYIYKATVVNLDNGNNAIKFYATVMPTSNLTVKYNVYNFSNTEILQSWRNPIASLEYDSAINSPRATTSIQSNAVNFNFKLPYEKIEIGNVSATEIPSASISRDTASNSFKLNLGIPKSNGEGQRGPAGKINVGTASASKVSYTQNPTVTISNSGSDSNAILDFNFNIPEGTPGISNVQQVTNDNSIKIEITDGSSTGSLKNVKLGHINQLSSIPETAGTYKLLFDEQGHISSIGNATTATDVGAVPAPQSASSGQVLQYISNTWQPHTIVTNDISNLSDYYLPHQAKHHIGGVDAINIAGLGISNQNLLDNPWFTICQYNNRFNFIADRWKKSAQNISYGYNENTYYIYFNGNNSYIQQTIIDNIKNQIVDKTLTVSVSYIDTSSMEDYEIISGTKFYDATETKTFIGSNITNKFKVEMQQIRTGGELTGHIFMITSNINSLKINKVKLEIGPYSTLCNDITPNYTSELLKCQRYYYAIFPGAKIAGHGYIYSANKAYISIQTPVPFISSSLTFRYGELSTMNIKYLTTSTNPTALSIEEVVNNLILLNVDCSATKAVYNAVTLAFSTSPMEFDTLY